LTVNNYASWCTVSVAGATTSISASQVVCLPPGNVTLVASPRDSTFILGPDPWHLTAGDNGSGDPGAQVDAGVNSTSTTHVVLTSGSTCVWACCPFSNGTGCAGIVDCP
jgi:hypothetical protein